MNNHFWWYVARSAGITAWVAIMGSMLTGFGLTIATIRRWLRVRELLVLHRYCGALSVVATALHITGLVADRYVAFGVVTVLLPLASQWRPGPVAWGVVAMYLLILIEGSSLLRGRISPIRWRKLHALSHPLAFFATVHFLSAGTDARRLVPLWAAVGIGGIVLAVTSWGVARSDRALLAAEQRRESRSETSTDATERLH